MAPPVALKDPPGAHWELPEDHSETHAMLPGAPKEPLVDPGEPKKVAPLTPRWCDGHPQDPSSDPAGVPQEPPCCPHGPPGRGQGLLGEPGKAATPVECGKQSLDASMTAWLSRAEADLILITGSSSKPMARGQIAKTITVDLLSTFKGLASGEQLASKACKWVQLRFVEIAKAIQKFVDTHQLYPLFVKARRRLRGLVSATCVHGFVKSPPSRLSLHQLRKRWHPKLKQVSIQTDQLIRLTGFCQPDTNVCKAIIARCTMLAKEAALQAASFEQEETSLVGEGWKQFLHIAQDSSAAIAHKYVKAPLSLGKFEKEGASSSRDEVLQQHVSLWSGLWKEDDLDVSLPTIKVPNDLELMSVDMIIRASKSCCRKTVGLGGLHPRHIALLPRRAIEALLLILHRAECLGRLPSQMLDTFIALLPKTSGGSRPIGLFPTLYRVWSKARSHLAKQWERAHTQGIGFAASRNASATDVVWRHSFLAESARNTGEHFCCILWDLKKCYETINHKMLLDAAAYHGYPISLLRMSLGAYQAPRRLLMHGLVSRQIVPRRGIVAASSFATTELRLYLLALVQRHNAVHNLVRINIYIDDISFDCTASNKHDVVEPIVCAASDFASDLCDRQLQLANDKAAVLSNHSDTARLVRAYLNDKAGPVVSQVRSLGIDFAGRPMPAKARPVARSRIAKFKKCKHRVSVLRKSKPKFASQVFTCEIIPSIWFDAPIFGPLFPSFQNDQEAGRACCGVAGQEKGPQHGLRPCPCEGSRSDSHKGSLFEKLQGTVERRAAAWG